VKSPPKKETRSWRTALQTAELHLAYHTIGFLAKLFGEPFWFFVQRRARLLDQIDNEASGQ
jgi:hypothetical protein